MDDLLTKKVIQISIGRIYGAMKVVYRVLDNLCEQMLGDSTLGLPTDYGVSGQADRVVIESLYTVQNMAGVARRNAGQVVHMTINAALGLPVDQGVPDVDTNLGD